jgi:LPXTG-motif cell wall-anchored protein
MSGIYGIEVNVLAQTGAGNIIDRAAFLTLDVQPTWLETAKNQILAVLLGIVLLIVIATLARLRRRNRYQK